MVVKQYNEVLKFWKFDFEFGDSNSDANGNSRNCTRLYLYSIPIIEGIKMRVHSDFIQFIRALKSTPAISKYRPPFLIRTLQSKACRSAIMFGNALKHSDANKLIHKLSNCSMPFICAHGRPTLAPI